LLPGKWLVVNYGTHIDIVFKGGWFVRVNRQTVSDFIRKSFLKLVTPGVFVQVQGVSPMWEFGKVGGDLRGLFQFADFAVGCSQLIRVCENTLELLKKVFVVCEVDYTFFVDKGGKPRIGVFLKVGADESHLCGSWEKAFGSMAKLR
jgi:hypothetical protein